MGWIPGVALAIAIAVAWRLSGQRTRDRWRKFEQALDDILAGRAIEGGELGKSACDEKIAPRLEALAEQQTRLKEQAGREAANLQTILGSMQEGVMVVDSQHVLRQTNPSFLEMFDVRSDPRGHTVLHTLREPELDEMVTRALQTGELQAQEVTLMGLKNARFFQVHALAMRDGEGKPGVVTIFHDISKLKQLENVRREFVANVSHELRTPLSIFHGFLENLLDDPIMPRKQQVEIFHILQKHSKRLNALLEDLLTLARLESRPEKLELKPVALGGFLRDVVSDWSGRAAKKNIELTAELPPALPAVSVDSLRIEQVLNNLLENAVKYTQQGGHVAIGATASESEVNIRVQDDGMGIPPSDLPHIFERFYRADKARSREHGGTGLGLSIAKHIVLSHGGSIRAESNYGKGTTISFQLPVQPEKMPAGSNAA